MTTPFRPFRSLRIRMALSHGVVLALIVLALGGVGYTLLQAWLAHQANDTVRLAALSEVDRLTEQGTERAAPDNDVPSSSAIQVALFLPNGRAVGDRGEVPSWLRPQRTALATVVVAGERVRVATTVVHGPAGVLRGTVVAAKSLAPDDRLLHEIRVLMIGGGLLSIAFGMGAGWLLAGPAARPAKRAYEAQAAFAANASHELRSPLAFIQTAVEVLGEPSPELGREVLEEIAYATRLTDRLLSMARSNARAVPMERTPTDVEQLCHQAAARARSVFGMQVELGGSGAATALVDPVVAGAVLDALLENAARHGGGHARISWQADRSGVTLSVADHGPGVPEELRERVFEPFFRADQARTRSSGGAGLGLALARSQVEAQEGRIWLSPTAGGGLTATVLFPRGRAGRREAGVRTRKEPATIDLSEGSPGPAR